MSLFDFIDNNRDNGIDHSNDIDGKHVIRYFDSTGEAKLYYSE